MDQRRAHQLLVFAAATLMIVIATNEQASACSVAPLASVRFLGTVTRVNADAGTALFYIDEVQSTRQVHWPTGLLAGEEIAMPAPSNDLLVQYRPGEEVLELRSGTQYRVDATRRAEPDVTWQSTTLQYFADWDSMCGDDEPAGTTYADGSPIEFRGKTVVREFMAADPRIRAVTVAVMLALVGSAWFVLRRKRARRSAERGLTVADDQRARPADA